MTSAAAADAAIPLLRRMAGRGRPVSSVAAAAASRRKETPSQAGSVVPAPAPPSLLVSPSTPLSRYPLQQQQHQLQLMRLPHFRYSGTQRFVSTSSSTREKGPKNGAAKPKKKKKAPISKEEARIKAKTKGQAKSLAKIQQAKAKTMAKAAQAAAIATQPQQQTTTPHIIMAGGAHENRDALNDMTANKQQLKLTFPEETKVATTPPQQMTTPHMTMGTGSSTAAQDGDSPSETKKEKGKKQKLKLSEAELAATAPPQQTTTPHMAMGTSAHDGDAPNDKKKEKENKEKLIFPEETLTSTPPPQQTTTPHMAVGTTDRDGENKHNMRVLDRETEIKFQAWEGLAREELLNQVRDYVQIWKDLSLDQSPTPYTKQKVVDLGSHIKNVPWKTSQLQRLKVHPSLADVSSWQHVVDTEEAYVQICMACHESLVELGNLNSVGDDMNDEEADDNYAQSDFTIFRQPSTIPSHDSKTDMAIIENQTNILLFWERIRNERVFMVEALRPIGYGRQEKTKGEDLPLTKGAAPATTTEEPKKQFFLIKWISSLFSKPDNSEEETPIAPPSKKEIFVEAHTLPQYTPNNYHYGRLIGRLYFRFPNQGLEENDWREQRAHKIQELVDRASPNGERVLSENRFLTKKSLLLLIRAYCDIGTFQGCKMAENVYHRHPFCGRHLLTYVLQGYHNITQNTANMVEQFEKDIIIKDNTAGNTSNAGNTADNSGDIPEDLTTALSEAAQSTKAVIKLLMQPRLEAPNRNRLMSIGFNCLLNTPPPALEDYYDLVKLLVKRKFGNIVVEQIYSTADKNKLTKNFVRPPDCATLYNLVLIYGSPPYRCLENLDKGRIPTKMKIDLLQRTELLMDLMFEKYPVSELVDVIGRSTFDTLLQPKAANPRTRKRNGLAITNQQFDFAMKLTDWMILSKTWWPTSDTWRALFVLATDGPRVDQVLRKHDLFVALSGETGLNPLTTTRYALESWGRKTEGLDTSSNNDKASPQSLPVERAWHLFQSLHTYSSPYFFDNDPSSVQHLYSPADAPDPYIYFLVWQTCAQAKDWETARKVYDISDEQKARGGLFFLSETYTAFLRCLVYCPDQILRRSLARQVFDEALENDQIGFSLVSILKRDYPELYQKLDENQKRGEIDDSPDILTNDSEEDEYDDHDGDIVLNPRDRKSGHCS